MYLLNFDFLFILPFILSVLFFVGFFITAIVLIIKHTNSIKNVSRNTSAKNTDDIITRIKEKINTKLKGNVCEYCGSNLGEKTECENCGAKISKK